MKNELYRNEDAFELPSKVIDETRQGETLTIDRIKTSPSNGKKFYIESYGCAMNFADSEVVASILSDSGYNSTSEFLDADLILINTCAIRDNAEQRVRFRLQHLSAVKKKKRGAIIAVLGCMAERLKEQFLEQEKIVDIVAGPDSYRSLPSLIEEAETGQKSVNVLLSREETYAEISPVRLNSNGITAFISIMRGCDNMCAFCVVPFTRGRERSRDYISIVAEANDLYTKGYREVTLLGQNVDSYRFSHDAKLIGKKLVDAKYDEGVVNFALLLEMVAQVAPDLRVRFSTSHPKDMSDDVLHTIAKYANICDYVHLPAQSGNSAVLDRMNRTYTREWFLERIAAIRKILPTAAISTDLITGFCGETEQEHQDTLSMMKEVRFELAYMYSYSERPGTLAAKKFTDDVPELVKKRRLQEIVDLHRGFALERNLEDVGKTYEVLVEGTSQKNENELFGRNSQNKVLVFAKKDFKPGQYVQVKVTASTSGTLLGQSI